MLPFGVLVMDLDKGLGIPFGFMVSVKDTIQVRISDTIM
jgi:hypothetical protein